MTAEGSRTLAHEVTDAFRIVVASALAMVAVLAAAVAWSVTVGNPAIDRTAKIVSVSQDASAALLEEQSMLRAYLVTGDRSILTSYPSVLNRISSDRRELDAITVGSGINPLTVAFDRAVGTWQHDWAVKAQASTTRRAFVMPKGGLDAAGLATFIRSGRDSFLVTQDAAHGVLTHGLAAQRRARQETGAVVVGTAIVLLAIGAATGLGALRRRRTVYSRVVGPIGVLLAKVQAVGRGEFGASPIIDAPVELTELRDELVNMSASLKLQQQVLASRADGAAASARRLKLVVEFAREISDSLTLSNVLGAVTAAGRRLVESPRARVWLFDEELDCLRLQYDSITGDVVAPLMHQIGEGGLGRAALDHRLYYSAGLTADRAGGVKPLVVAVPLVKGNRLIGVLEIALKPGSGRLDPATGDVLTATAGHAATAIDAALLYALSESLSRSDALTGLANRRQLDSDLELEVERSGRYARPMTFMMIDIDHFKAVNDTFGHALGDSVLREVAIILREHMRGGDTAYRYGGEEFAVLARETDLEGGMAVAERLRQAIQDRYSAAATGDLAVTISVGLAAVAANTASAADLVAAADRALYEAKRDGRNLVRAAAGGPEEIPTQRAWAIR